MIQLVAIEQKQDKPEAIIVAKNKSYQALAYSLSNKLALGRCSVKIKEKLLPKELFAANYLIYLGLPTKEELKIINQAKYQKAIAVEGSFVDEKTKTDLKYMPVVFLPKDFDSQINTTINIILEVLFTQTRLKKKTTKINKRLAEVKKGNKIPEPDASLVEKVHYIDPGLIKKTLFIIGSIVIFAGILLYPYLLFNQIKNSLFSSISALKEADFQTAKTQAFKAKIKINRAEKLYSYFQPIIAAVAPKESEALTVDLDLSKQAIDIINTASGVGARGGDFIAKLLTHEQLAVEQDILFFEKNISLLQVKLSEFQKTTNSLSNNPSFVARKTIKLASAYSKTLGEASALLDQASRVLPILPDIFAGSGRKKYLVLFQNNMELRPTGGFIGSVGFLRFENGKMLEITIEDVYSLDGQLEGQVDPPVPISTYLGEASWYLRDANWHPDFPKSAQQIEWFLKKEIQTDVDGVLAVDLEFAKRILSALGGVVVLDYDTLVTADNLYLKTQTKTENDFFPGSTKKRDFLGSLARSILLELATRKSLPTTEILKGLSESLSEKHVLIYLHSDSAQKVFDSLGWTGRLLQPTCYNNLSLCVPDYLMVVNANLGVNKVNYFIDQALQFNITFEKNRLRRNIKLTLINQGSSDKFLGGVYKDYLRILVPPNSVLESVQVNHKQIALTRIDKELLELYQAYGLLVEIPPGERREISIAYSSPASFQNLSNYELLVQKQPGTNSSALTINVKKTAGAQLKAINFTPLVTDDGLRYNTNLNTDKIFRVQILY